MRVVGVVVGGRFTLQVRTSDHHTIIYIFSCLFSSFSLYMLEGGVWLFFFFGVFVYKIMLVEILRFARFFITWESGAQYCECLRTYAPYAQLFYSTFISAIIKRIKKMWFYTFIITWVLITRGFLYVFHAQSGWFNFIYNISLRLRKILENAVVQQFKYNEILWVLGLKQ